MNSNSKLDMSKKSDVFFMILTTIFITSLLVTNVIAGKFFVIFDLPLSCGIIAYPMTFMVTDIVSEVYGEKKANMLVRIGFVISILITIFILLSNALPTHPESPVDKKSFTQIFGLTPGIILGSMIAYLSSQLIDIKVFEFFRKLFPNSLWIRNNCSTIFSQLVDTAIVVTISLVIWPLILQNSAHIPIGISLWLKIIFGQYVFKALLAILDTPFVYTGVYLTKRLIGIPNQSILK